MILILEAITNLKAIGAHFMKWFIVILSHLCWRKHAQTASLFIAVIERREEESMRACVR